jgi:hypothetical protein
LVVIVEWVVIAVAVFVIARNVIPQLQNSTGGTSGANTSALNPPTQTPAPTATVDASLYDFSTATTFKSPDGVVQISLPKGWQLTPPAVGSTPTPGRYEFLPGGTNGTTGAPGPTNLEIVIDDPSVLYRGLNADSSVTNAQQALASVAKGGSPDGSVTFGPVGPLKVGTLDGFVLDIHVAANAQGQPPTEVELILAPLSNGKMMYIGLQSSPDTWKVAKPTLDKMVQSIVINTGAIPTQTPTPTPLVPELTLTALQQQISTVQATILALTPTTTPIPTQAATGAASAGTAAATAAANSAAPAATAAATSAATVPVTTAAPATTVAPTTAPTTAVPTTAPTTAAPTATPTATSVPPSATNTSTATATNTPS